jgi:hypothetical protein
MRALSVIPALRPASCIEFLHHLTGRDELAIEPPEQKLEIADLSEQQAVERRCGVRHPCELESLCSPVGGIGQLSWKAAVTNISGNGIGLILHRRFERGTVLDLRWQRAIRDAIGTTTARVVRTQAQESGQWLLGCQLARRLDDKDLGIVLAHGIPRSGPGTPFRAG